MAYFSNGSEGEILDRQCAECPVGRDPQAQCPVLLAQSVWNYDQIKNGQRTEVSRVLDLLVNQEGICLMRKAMMEAKPPEFELGKPCPMCGAKDRVMKYYAGCGASSECWIRSCGHCGHEMSS